MLQFSHQGSINEILPSHQIGKKYNIVNLGEAYLLFYCTHLPPTHHHHCQAHSVKLNLLTYLALMREQSSVSWDTSMFHCAISSSLVSVGPSEEQSFCLNLIAKKVFSESVLSFPLHDVSVVHEMLSRYSHWETMSKCSHLLEK